MRRVLGILCCGATVLGLIPPCAASADVTITTTDLGSNLDTPGTCSLRDAIRSANADMPIGTCPMGTYGNDTIVLGGGTTYNLTQFGPPEDLGAVGDLDVADMGSLTIRGVGSTISAAGLEGTNPDRVLDVQPDAQLILQGVNIRGGHLTGAADNGAGIRNQGKLTMSLGDVSGNHAGGDGGGIATDAPGMGNGMTLTNVTVSSNQADGNAGGIFKDDAGAELNNVTLAGNTADADANGGGNGGGFRALSGAVNFHNSVVTGNIDASPMAADKQPDCSAGGESAGYSLIGDTTGCSWTPDATDVPIGSGAGLGPLSPSGPGTFTHALLLGSPLIDRGFGCPEIDQRLIHRPQGGGCDIGAYELVAPGTATRPALVPTAGAAKKCKKGHKPVKRHGKRRCVKKKKK